jgi:hypothetical protein
MWPGAADADGSVEIVTPYAGYALDTGDVWVGGQVQYLDKTGTAQLVPFLAYSTTAPTCP